MRAAEFIAVGVLVDSVPELRPLLQEHLDGYDALLPHLFLADVVRELVAAGDPDLTSSVLRVLEDVFRRGSDHERELIAVSFLDNLPSPGQAGSGVRQSLGPQMARELVRLSRDN